MPKLSTDQLPKLRRKIVQGREYAVVALNGHQVMLGYYGTEIARRRYDEVVQQWQDAGRVWHGAAGRLTVRDLVAAFAKHATTYFVNPDGTPARELQNYKDATKPLLRLFGDVLILQFDPLKLKHLQNELVRLNWCRAYINRQIGRVRRIFRWGVSENLVPAPLLAALETVDGFREHRSRARERGPVQPVDEAHGLMIVPHVNEKVGAMLQLQFLTGMRSAELCSLRPIDLDTSQDVWRYRPAEHKTQHHGKTRVVLIGPQAQQILQPLLPVELSSRVFAPYVTKSYYRAIARGCEAAWPPPAHLARRRVEVEGHKKSRWETRQEWHERLSPAGRAELIAWRKRHHFHPHQIRHTVATRVRAQHGAESARAVLGHAKLKTTEIYAERDEASAAAIMRVMG